MNHTVNVGYDYKNIFSSCIEVQWMLVDVLFCCAFSSGEDRMVCFP